jgi:caa(3)-type oxidase subunit IV
MSTPTAAVSRRYLTVWIWLLVLMSASLLASGLPVTRAAIVTLMFVVAAVKAVLVALHFMHLRLESWLIYTIATVPVLLVLGLMVTLFPDFVFAR